jgi:hypothetical protein
MKKQTSSKTKWLLAVLSVIAIAALFIQFMLLPLIDRHAQARQKNQNAVARLASMQNLDERAAIARAQAEAAINTFGEDAADYIKFDTPEDIERAFTDAITSAGLEPMSVNIIKQEITDEDPFERHLVEMRASGTVNAIYLLCDYINGIFSYRLSDVRIVENNDGSHTATVRAYVLYVKEELIRQ